MEVVKWYMVLFLNSYQLAQHLPSFFPYLSTYDYHSHNPILLNSLHCYLLNSFFFKYFLIFF